MRCGRALEAEVAPGEDEAEPVSTGGPADAPIDAAEPQAAEPPALQLPTDAVAVQLSTPARLAGLGGSKDSPADVADTVICVSCDTTASSEAATMN